MIEMEVMLFGLIGALTSLIISFFVTEGKAVRLNILLVLLGALTGWIGGMIWVVLTGGLEITLFALVIPVFVSALFTYLILDRTSARSLGNMHVDKRLSVLALAGLFVLSFGVAYTAIPIDFKPTMNTQQFTVAPLSYVPGEKTITMPSSIAPTNAIPMDINCVGSSTTFSTMAENPNTGAYYDFKIYFTPKIPWSMPYIKMAIYEDKDGDGKLSTGDVLWSDADYKLSTGSSNWRINCLWDNTCADCNPQAKYGMFTSNGKLLPIFHAETMTQTIDDTKGNFLNTPEAFIPSVDMLSWDSKGIKEQIVTYAAISADETSSIQGKAYCSNEHLGKNIIVVKTYCACSSDPFGDGQPIQEKIIPFSVTPMAEEANLSGMPLPGIALILGFLVLLAFLFAKKEGEL